MQHKLWNYCTLYSGKYVKHIYAYNSSTTSAFNSMLGKTYQSIKYDGWYSDLDKDLIPTRFFLLLYIYLKLFGNSSRNLVGLGKILSGTDGLNAGVSYQKKKTIWNSFEKSIEGFWGSKVREMFGRVSIAPVADGNYFLPATTPFDFTPALQEKSFFLPFPY